MDSEGGTSGVGCSGGEVEGDSPAGSIHVRSGEEIAENGDTVMDNGVSVHSEERANSTEHGNGGFENNGSRNAGMAESGGNFGLTFCQDEAQ